MAHISTIGDVSWLCWPKFDSPFLFGSMLDHNKGGHFRITPADENFTSHQTYIENTNILSTEFDSPSGKFRIIDFAPRFRQHARYYRPLMLVRKIEYLSGNPVIKISCKPVNGYSLEPVRMHEGSNHLEFEGFNDAVRLTTDVPLTFIQQERDFLLHETHYMVLTYGIPLEKNLSYTCEDFLHRTIEYWRMWVKSSYIPTRFQSEVIRSSLALKIHQYEQTGAIIAAATTSLPEIPGKGRNWDYRYCWLRDAYYILTAFNNIGHFEELEKYFQYIANVSLIDKERLQPLYTVDGHHDIKEYELPMEGYFGNKPVRIGNAAYKHIQNDVYGQVLVSLQPLFTDLRFNNRERHRNLDLVHRLLKMIDITMEESDAGLWEFRNRSNLHGYTFLFHWAGSNAAIKILNQYGVENGLQTYAQNLRNKAAQQIEKCYSPETGMYNQAIGSKDGDFSLVQLITLGYLDGNSPKAHQHLNALEQMLSAGNGLFFRYKHVDDFGKPESAFLICSFWYVEALVCTGRYDEAADVFQKLMSYSNHLGLFSEDVSPDDFSQWGNFPQAYSHVGLINAASRLARRTDKPIFL